MPFFSHFSHTLECLFAIERILLMKPRSPHVKSLLCALVLLLVLCVATALASANSPFPEAIRSQIDALADPSLVDLTGEALTLTQMNALMEAYPGTAFRWKLSIYGQTVSWSDTAIDLGETVVTDYDELIRFLTAFPSLTTVDMYATPIYKPEIERLAAAFPDTLFGWTMRVGNHTIRTDATAFSTLFRDSRVEPRHTSEEFEIIKYCRNLYALDLGHMYIDDTTFISGLTELRILILAKAELTDITPLASLVKLEYLELFCNRIVDISPLAGMTELSYAELSVNEIKDFSPLYNLPKLKRINVTRNDKSVLKDDLRKAMPDCRIDISLNPTQGNWRKSARYRWARRIFHTGTYREWTRD